MNSSLIYEQINDLFSNVNAYKIALGFFVGWFLAIFTGELTADFTKRIHKKLKASLPKSTFPDWGKFVLDDKFVESTEWLGRFEVTLFYISLFFKPEGIGVWLVFKVTANRSEGTGGEIIELKKHGFELAQEKTSTTGQIFGTIACRGKITGKVALILSKADEAKINSESVVVTEMTMPQMVPLLLKAAAIVTDHGGRTSHAAIVSRELGTPCIVGSKNATKVLKNNQLVAVDCTQGQEGRVFAGKVPYDKKEYDPAYVPNFQELTEIIRQENNND